MRFWRRGMHDERRIQGAIAIMFSPAPASVGGFMRSKLRPWVSVILDSNPPQFCECRRHLILSELRCALLNKRPQVAISSIVTVRRLQLLRYFLGKIMTLDEIGLENGTDKASTKNDFLRRYEPFLASMRDDPIKLLEIGVLGGASIRTWRDYFKNGMIIGADINPEVKKYTDDRIAIEIIDQSMPTDLDALASKGPFDVIIDDGSHIWSHQILTLRKLLPVLKPNGIFIIEDLDTSHGKYKRTYGSPGYVTAHDYLQRISDWTVGIWVKDRAEIEDEFLIAAADTLEFVAFTRGAAILKKKAPR